MRIFKLKYFVLTFFGGFINSAESQVIDLAGQLRSDYTAQNGYPCFSSQFNALTKVGAN